ncbi:MAG: M24 family metallopeptidase [Candidatus Pacebacteria bacterium]|nr:M24 family metallopeptidase [Candidatus Paceibacterota bacterium]
MESVTLIHQIRAAKNKKELANIIKAQRISEKVLADVVLRVKIGVTEIELANYIASQFKKYGAPILSFSPIVAFGKNSANIHHEPGKSKLKKGDMVMFDFGCTVNHYCSDMTRTYFFGEPTAKQKKVYLDVLGAMEQAMKKLAVGEKRAKIIDASARKFLAKKYKDNFQHGLGHGVGTVIHEWPNFKPKSEDVLPVGCVMTIEPGIYLKGFGGVRIEDMVLITANGYENLTKVPKDLESAILK